MSEDTLEVLAIAIGVPFGLAILSLGMILSINLFVEHQAKMCQEYHYQCEVEK